MDNAENINRQTPPLTPHEEMRMNVIDNPEHPSLYCIPTHNTYALLQDECNDDSDNEAEERGVEYDAREPRLQNHIVTRRETQNEQRSQPMGSGSFLLSVSANPPASPTTQIYIGGVFIKAITQNVIDELTFRSISQDRISVRMLNQSKVKKSFVATIPSTMKGRILNCQQWKEGIIVQPFR